MAYMTPRIYALLGINNSISPCSVAYREGMAWQATNSRINESGLWDKGPYMGSVRTGGYTVTTIPKGTTGAGTVAKTIGTIDGNGTTVTVTITSHGFSTNDLVTISGTTSYNVSNVWITVSDANTFTYSSTVNEAVENSGTCTWTAHAGSYCHAKQVSILGTSYVANNLNKTTRLEVGPNRYGYIVDDALCETSLSERGPYWWDGAGTTKHSSTTSLGDFGPAGLGRPATITKGGTVTSGAIQVFDNGGSLLGGRMEAGIYYYMYTYYDSSRDVESLPSPVVDWDAAVRASWTGIQNSTKYPILRVVPDATHTVTIGSKRYDTNTKIRFYRSKRTSETDGMYNAPNEFYFLNEVSYTLDVTPTAVTCENPFKFTKTAHGLSTGDRALVRGLTGADAGDINDRVWSVTRVDADNFTVFYDASAKTITLGSCTVSENFLEDFFHDEELTEMYEGRGTPPPTNIDCLCPFENRMYYFKDATVYWSSAGRPEEVAQEYTLQYCLQDSAGDTSYGGVTCQYTTLTMKPWLMQGIQAEAKYEISELFGETVKATFPFNGRLYIFTDNTTGYLRPSTSTEGVKYYLLRRGVGCCSDKTINLTPYGLFAADRKGVWNLNDNNVVKRLSENRIDHDTSSKDTYVYQSTIGDSFGVWVPDLNEYVWCAVNTLAATGTVSDLDVVTGTATVTTSMAHGLSSNDCVVLWINSWSTAIYAQITVTTTTKFTFTTSQTGTNLVGKWAKMSYVQMAYQPDWDIWSGVYKNVNMRGGCQIMTTRGVSSYFNIMTGTYYEMSKPTSSYYPALTQTLQFWFGSSSLQYVKHMIKHRIIYESCTADKNITVTAYQNKIASTTGSTSLSISHNDDNLVGVIEPIGSGRMMMVQLSIPSDCYSPIIAIDTEYDPVPLEAANDR
jgi:hypothetical protein